MLTNSQIIEYKKSLKSFLYNKYGYNEMIPDIIQETFYNYFSGNNYDPSRQPISLLFNIAEHKLIDIIRHKERTVKFNDNIQETFKNNILPPDKIYENSEIRNRITQEIKNINPLLSDVFIRNQVHEETFENICKDKNIKLGTALFRSYKCKKILREKLQDMKEYVN
jgi:RNA polymerase sigma factor (sigma-70 family)